MGCPFNPYVLNEESEAVVRARGPMALARVASLFPTPVPLAVCSLATRSPPSHYFLRSWGALLM